MIRALALALVPVAFLALASITQAEQAGQSTLVVHVVNDLDEDGLRDDGEPGLAGWELWSGCGDAFVGLGPTETDGTFVYYRADSHECLHLQVQFGWFATSPKSIDLEVQPEEQSEAVFMVRHVGDDVEHFVGSAIVDGLPAPMTVALDALIDGISCSDSLLTTIRGATHYQLYVLGASERPGCAEAGDTILFTIDGVPSAIGVYESGPGDSRSLDLISGPIPMYFTFWGSEGGAVTARIAGTVCGQGFLFGGGLVPAGSQSVFVRAAASAAGCGEDGKVVNLQVGDAVVAQVLWREGEVFGDDLQHLGDANCDRNANSIDAALILQYSARVIELDDLDCLDASDVDRRGRIDALDAALVLQLEAGLIEYFP